MLENAKKKIDEKYLKSEISRIEDDDLNMVMDNKKEITNKISHASILKKYTELGKLMFGMLKDYKKGNYKSVPWFTIAAIAFSLLYVLNPFDLVPDFIPGVGYIDDFLVFSLSLRFIESDLHNYLDWKLDKS